MKRQNTLIALLLISSIGIFAQSIKVGFYQELKPSQSDESIKSACKFISSNDAFEAKRISPKELKKIKKLLPFEIIWLHITDTLKKPEEHFDAEALMTLQNYVRNGGNLLLTREAFGLITLLGLENEKPELVEKYASDNGYGRMLGFHAFRDHPIFSALHGGAYILKPSNNMRLRNYGYFEGKVPRAGKVVATDWDYIFLRENKKLILEYELGNGKILAVGAYMYFELPSKNDAGEGQPYNVNRQHLEKFTLNCMEYLAGRMNDQPAFYWNYNPAVFENFNSGALKYFPMMQPQKPAHHWLTEPSEIQLTNRFGSENYWDVAGERLLVMGKEKGGIDEVWAHPFMAFRDYEAGIQFSNNDSIFWLNDEKPLVEVNPESFTRLYQINGAFLTEIITVSPDKPHGIIHYEYHGEQSAQLFIRFKTNQRIMWPYAHQVLGGMKYDFHEALNTFIITDPSGDFVTMLGFNKETRALHFNESPLLPAIKKLTNPIGHFSEIYPVDSIWYGLPAKDYIISAMTGIKLEMDDYLDVVFAAGNEGVDKAISAFEYAKNDPEKIHRQAINHRQATKDNFINFHSPDTIFNLAYQWALTGSEQFVVKTPGLGSSIVAGYGTTAKGWDGEHEVNGRPGYSWYFGRDAVWSAFALLQYGDFEKVKAILEMFQKFQDLNGKIYHELSTSGFVHYDASDATPLYVILAGRYLKQSGDIDFIRESQTHLKAAMDFLYSTDTDGDGLIENTNVGHGWVEGGKLFGSHTSLYLASCWAEALDESAYIFGKLGEEFLSTQYADDAASVIISINEKYWNDEQAYFYHGFRPDQSFIGEESIMPAIPVLFGQTETKKADLVTARFGTNAYTADWGARIISENSPSFNPKGYHSGSVWPLYTGWVALAEYKTGRHIQGFSHLMNNLLVYDDWALGNIEEVLHGEEYLSSGVCHHQCWSQTMALQPVFEGMLGLNPDAIKNSLELRPTFPANWDSVNIQNIRVGSHNIRFSQSRKKNIISYQFIKENPETLQIDFAPHLPAGTEIISKSLNGIIQTPDNENSASISFTIEKEATIQIQVAGGIEVLPVYVNPRPGSKSLGFRITDEHLVKNIYTIDFEGKPAAIEEFSIFINGNKPVKVEKAELIQNVGNIYTYKVYFPNVDSKYVQQKVKIFFD
ncbi:MAG: hypothetical protein K9H16_12420 [Bacteroidales bacterium]|nr:hypothetical protein [Bacteroidales bacterium]